MRIATYARISTDEEHQPYSLEAQAERLSSYAASQDDWRIVRRFTDQTSGATLDRPGLQRVLAEAKARRFDLLLVYRVDRLARSVRGLAHILETLDKAGVLFRSATEPFDTSTSAGRMMVQMLGVFAEFERATIVERVIAGMERKAARGEWTGGSIPFGYQLDVERRHLQPDTYEAPIVKEIFKRYAQRNIGTATLAAWLTEHGYRTKQGRPFNVPAVLTILRNRAYLGEIYYRGRHHPAPHKPLVEQELFERAQAVLKERSEDHSKRRSNQSEYLLTGLVRCERCGKRYVGAAAHGKGGRYPYYICFTRHRYGRATCQNDRLPAPKLEDAILRQLARLLENTPLLQQAIHNAHAQLQSARPERQAEATRIDAEIKRTNTALDRYFHAFEHGTMPESACGARIKQLTSKLQGLEGRRQELEAQHDQAPPPLGKDDLAMLKTHVREVIEHGDPPTRKALLQALIHEIRVTDRSEIHPVFSLPAVRPPSGSVPPPGVEPGSTA
jgi:site-specific DNA recombinase